MATLLRVSVPSLLLLARVPADCSSPVAVYSYGQCMPLKAQPCDGGSIDNDAGGLPADPSRMRLTRN